MLLWLDDRRDPKEHGCPDWFWVRTAEEALIMLASGKVLAASLDHDLGPGKDGHDVVVWMEMTGLWPPHGVFVHSGNVVGKLRMWQAIDRKFPELARHRNDAGTPLEQGVRADFLAKRSIASEGG